MTAPVFVVEQLPGGPEFVLDGSEGRHAVSVKRLNAGEDVVLTDGRGHWAEGVVRATEGKDRLLVMDLESVYEEPVPSPRITVVQALPKGDRGEVAVETMTETGVDAIVPWQASRCITQWKGDRGLKSLAKWRSTAREAGKQSRRVRFPEVSGVMTTKQVAALLAAADFAGVLHEDRPDLNPVKLSLARDTNTGGLSGRLVDALVGADLFLGVSGGTVPEEAVAQMADDAMIFALANPNPEVHPDIAHRHAAVVATGRSDFPNQINNVLAFPGIFRGAFDANASRITEGMKLAAADALAALISPEDVRPDYIIPSPFDPRVALAVAEAVASAAHTDGVARPA